MPDIPCKMTRAGDRAEKSLLFAFDKQMTCQSSVDNMD